MPKLLPSRTKFRKVFKGRVRGTASKGNTVSFGEFGIQSLSRGRMTSNQIEAARVAINRHLKRKGKVWIRVFPHKPVTKKPAETRQGKEKDLLIIGLRLLNLVMFCLKLPAVLNLPEKHWAWLMQTSISLSFDSKTTIFLMKCRNK